jgi:hypothetical protein
MTPRAGTPDVAEPRPGMLQFFSDNLIGFVMQQAAWRLYSSRVNPEEET